jgi:hypothetical protein
VTTARTTHGERSKVVSSFTIVKGALIAETYDLFRVWDLTRSKRENLVALTSGSLSVTGSRTWRRDVAKVVNRRFDPASRDRPLVELAQGGCRLDLWKPILLWHMTRDEFLVRDFLVSWLYPRFTDGVYRSHARDVLPYLKTLEAKGGVTEGAWSSNTAERVATGLLRIATDFDLVQGTTVREFRPYHLADDSLLYLLHAAAEQEPNASKLLGLPDWHMYLMAADDVERELLRLHQYHKLNYQVAGSMRQLSLPFYTAAEYARRMIS